MAAIDYTPFDIPEISSMAFYPQQVWLPPPADADDVMIPVGDGVELSGRFYKHDKAAPTILFFHGNGEVAYMYDDIAPHYHRAGANFFAVDFRGYGRSGGSPSFSTMIGDSNATFEFVKVYVAEAGYAGPLFVKGRSLGTHSAIEVAARHAPEVRGLMVESGSAVMDRMTSRYGLDPETPAVKEALRQHEEKVRSITLPLLIIHGERDDLVPTESAVTLYDMVGSEHKEIELIPGAGHNDLLWLGMPQYFGAVAKFVDGFK